MSGPGRRQRQEYQEAVAYACAEFADLEAEVGAGWAPAIETVRAGEPGSAQWYEAVRHLHRLAEEAGIPGGLGLTGVMGAHDWLQAPPPVTGWVCPNGACERVQRAERGQLGQNGQAGQTAPECRLLARPMRHVAG
ncbi:hypothetical protein ACIBCA_18695 [Kitasatospora sp. NPDC051170]|uniref:hypothetical protein n=1 Tax=Kitasatospora sp. NPDC051170 TaxID=3364056 RepID=UPI0037948CB6